MRHLILLLFFTLTALVNTNAFAQDLESHIEPTLYSSVDRAVPRQTFDVALELIIDEKWHTYWKNPGDSGIPITVTWTRPENVEISDLQWPTPSINRVESIVDFGYAERAILTTSVTLSENFDASEFVLTADLNMLVCKEICIPENDTVQLVLPVGETPESTNDDIFADALRMMPETFEGQATYSEKDGFFILNFKPAFENLQTVSDIQLFPEEWGIILNGTVPKFAVQDNVAVFSIGRGSRELGEISSLAGVLKYTSNGKEKSYQFNSTFDEQTQVPENTLTTFAGQEGEEIPAPTIPPQTSIETTDSSSDIGFLKALIFAFIGGLILNLMPCVFPILSMKALSFTKLSTKERKDAAKHGLLYTAGVIISMLVFAGIISVLQAGGSQIGWGFQLQNPLIVALLFWLFFVIGLNLLGLFDVTSSFSNIGHRLKSKNGYRNDFLTGVLVVIVATPCTAPFMAAAVGYALVHSPIVTFSIFTGLGLGLALPFLLLSVSPALQKFMPKPGSWMVIFKQIIAFPMFLACIWLAWVIALQTGADGIAATLFIATLIAFFIWFSQITSGLLFFIITFLCLFGFYKGVHVIYEADMAIEERVESRKHSDAIPYTPEALETALAGQNPIFVNMTAAWCITCKVNEKTTIKSENVQNFLNKNSVDYIVGDWTRFDENITDYLAQFKRSGVPIYVFYPAPDENNIRGKPIVLPQILTPSLVIETMQTNL